MAEEGAADKEKRAHVEKRKEKWDVTRPHIPLFRSVKLDFPNLLWIFDLTTKMH